MDFANIRVDVADGLGRITLNRPERRNAMSLALLQELREALAALGAQPAVTALIVEGAGPVFFRRS